MTQPTAPVMQTFNPAVLGSNPWDSTVSSDSGAQASVTQGAQSTIAGLNGQISAMGGTPQTDPSTGSAYPAMANAYGLGSQSNVGAGVGSQPINVSMPDTSTRGANPWSLVGESNSRGGGPPPTTPLSSQG